MRELLDLPLGGLEPRQAEAEQLLAPLPERNRLVQARLAALQPLDDLLQLLLGRLEGQLTHEHSSTRAPKPPSASSTSTRDPGTSRDGVRRIAPSERTIGVAPAQGGARRERRQPALCPLDRAAAALDEQDGAAAKPLAERREPPVRRARAASAHPARARRACE